MMQIMMRSMRGILAGAVALLVLLAGSPARAQSAAEPPKAASFEGAASAVERQLAQSVADLNALRERLAKEKIPLSRKLSDLEAELAKVRLQYQQTTRLLDSRTLDLSNLKAEIKSREDESSYLSNLLGEYTRNFESRLHIAERQRYEGPLDTAKLAPENSNLTDEEKYQAQAALLAVSLDRLQDALGGVRFEGSAVDSSGLVRKGTYALIGPAALFRSTDGRDVGTAEQRLGSLEPASIAFENKEDAAAAAQVVSAGSGYFPLDPSLGNAHKIAATHESFIEHVKKGGPVMVPIFILAGASLLVVLFKWISLAFVARPSRKQISALLNAVGRRDEKAARQRVAEIKGPVGRMLAAGVDHLREPRELIEEIMYETVLITRMKLQKYLPFVAICAASAPLLGLLGTVTGIINTFKLITVFGSGDVKTLSSGISEALITTEFGLIVAIPSLLLHAFLSRKARSVIGQMEGAAISFVNQVGMTEVPAPPSLEVPKREELISVVKGQVKEILNDLLRPVRKEDMEDELTRTQRA